MPRLESRHGGQRRRPRGSATEREQEGRRRNKLRNDGRESDDGGKAGRSSDGTRITNTQLLSRSLADETELELWFNENIEKKREKRKK
jgi:hypothetical protein